MSVIKQEKLIEEQPRPVSIEGTREILSQMENSICMIYPEDNINGTGFFCKIPFLNNCLPVLITNNHILNENDIKNNKIIKLSINGKVKEIKIDNSRKKYTNPDKNIDITIIEIKPNEDGIGIDNFLELDEKNINKDKKNIEVEYKMKSIYILHYPRGKLKVSYGLIKNIVDNKNIYHYCNTDDGSSGSPILSLKTFKVIGIHYGSNKSNIKINYGTFIKYAIDLFDNFNNNNENNNCPKDFEIGNMFDKSMLSYPSKYNRKTFKKNNNNNNKYNNHSLIHSYFFKNMRLCNNSQTYRKTIDSNLGITTDKTDPKENNIISITNRENSTNDLIKFRKNNFSYLDNNHQLKSKPSREMNKANHIFYDKNGNYHNRIIYKNSMSLTKNKSPLNSVENNINNNLKNEFSKKNKELLIKENASSFGNYKENHEENKKIKNNTSINFFLGISRNKKLYNQRNNPSEHINNKNNISGIDRLSFPNSNEQNCNNKDRYLNGHSKIKTEPCMNEFAKIKLNERILFPSSSENFIYLNKNLTDKKQNIEEDNKNANNNIYNKKEKYLIKKKLIPHAQTYFSKTPDNSKKKNKHKYNSPLDYLISIKKKENVMKIKKVI